MLAIAAETPTSAGGGSIFSTAIIPFILLIGLLCYLLIRLVKGHLADVHSGKSRRLNRLFWILCALGGVIDFLIIGFIIDWDFQPSEVFLYLILLIIPGIFTQCLYFIPYLIANKKGHPQETAIFILNLFAGWTILAWIIALVWAFIKPRPVSNMQQTPISSADELIKYKNMLDSGVISQEEFDKKKKDLLNI